MNWDPLPPSTPTPVSDPLFGLKEMIEYVARTADEIVNKQTKKYVIDLEDLINSPLSAQKIIRLRLHAEINRLKKLKGMTWEGVTVFERLEDLPYGGDEIEAGKPFDGNFEIQNDDHIRRPPDYVAIDMIKAWKKWAARTGLIPPPDESD